MLECALRDHKEQDHLNALISEQIRFPTRSHGYLVEFKMALIIRFLRLNPVTAAYCYAQANKKNRLFT